MLDVIMPDLDGFEVCRRLKNAPETHMIPVIFITALQSMAALILGLHPNTLRFPMQKLNIKRS